MADNYLEKRYEEVFGSGAKAASKKHNAGKPSLDSLFIKNRSVRGYDPSRKVSLEELREIIAVNSKIASSKNWQVLRFKAVTSGPEADVVNANIKMGALFRKRHASDPENNPDLPLKGTEPQAFVVVFSKEPENSSVLIDLGISLQSMSLKAVELGLNCLMIRAINKAALKEAFSTELEPVAVLAVGKSAEKIFMLPIHDGENQEYFRKEGIHYVPKLQLEDILI